MSKVLEPQGVGKAVRLPPNYLDVRTISISEQIAVIRKRRQTHRNLAMEGKKHKCKTRALDDRWTGCDAWRVARAERAAAAKYPSIDV